MVFIEQIKTNHTETCPSTNIAYQKLLVLLKSFKECFDILRRELLETRSYTKYHHSESFHNVIWNIAKKIVCFFCYFEATSNLAVVKYNLGNAGGVCRFLEAVNGECFVE